MFCKVCGNKIVKDNKKCSECGVRFSSSYYKNVHFHCAHCGGELAEGDKVCAHCYNDVYSEIRVDVKEKIKNISFFKINKHKEKKEQVESTENVVKLKDYPSTEYFWWSLISPIIGLTLYLTWKYNCPLRADSAFRGMRLGIIIQVIIWAILQFIQCSILF